MYRWVIDWIPVEHALPPMGELVLLSCHDIRYAFPGQRRGTEGEWWWHGTLGRVSVAIDAWSPMPPRMCIPPRVMEIDEEVVSSS